MKITNVLLGLLVLLCVACDKSEKETQSGMKYSVIKAGSGDVPKLNDVVVFNYKLIDSKDSVWDDTYSKGMPAAILIRDTSMIKFEDGMVQMIRMASEGDSLKAEFSFHDWSVQIARGFVPMGVDTTRRLTYYVKIDSISTRDAVMAMQSELMEKQQKAQLTKDITTIDAYLESNKIVAEKTESGMRYVITNPGTGENGKSGQVTKVIYSGYLLNGQYFDSNDKTVAQAKGLYDPSREPYPPTEVTIDRTAVIRGWHEALKLMNKGSKATFYIPSSLAYGPQQRSEVIKPNSILVFDLEMVDLK